MPPDDLFYWNDATLNFLAVHVPFPWFVQINLTDVWPYGRVFETTSGFHREFFTLNDPKVSFIHVGNNERDALSRMKCLTEQKHVHHLFERTPIMFYYVFFKIKIELTFFAISLFFTLEIGQSLKLDTTSPLWHPLLPLYHQLSISSTPHQTLQKVELCSWVHPHEIHRRSSFLKCYS